MEAKQDSLFLEDMRRQEAKIRGCNSRGFHLCDMDVVFIAAPPKVICVDCGSFLIKPVQPQFVKISLEGKIVN